MSRQKYESAEEARELLNDGRGCPTVLEQHDRLPFDRLTGKQFEVFCFSLVLREEATDDAVLYGGPGDKGRDIVRTLTDGTQRFIQCKCSESNIGVREVRQELAKICVKSHEDEIPQNPDTVRFYVSLEFTAKALDLIKNQEQWESAAKGALEEYLGEAPSEDLVEFALDWWPEPHPVNGYELTNRARKYPKLIDEFFSRQKVVDGSKEEVAEHVVRSLQNEFSVAQPEPESFQDFLQRAEANNPGLNVTAKSTSGQTTFRIEPEDAEAIDREFGKLSFPDTEAGRRGAQKFQKTKEEGRQIELKGAEFVWKPNFNEPLPEGRAGDEASLRLSPAIERQEFDVRLEAYEEDTVVQEIPISTLFVERAGTKETELKIEGKQFAASFSMVLPEPIDGGGSSQLTLNLTEFRPEVGLETVRLVDAIQKGAALRVHVFELGKPLFGGIDVNTTVEHQYVSEVEELLQYYSDLNEEFGLSLRYPEEPADDEFRIVEVLGKGVQGFAVAETVDGDFSIRLPRRSATSLLQEWEDTGAIEITLGRASKYQIQGEQIEMGEERLVLKESLPVESLEALRERLAAVEYDEGVEIDLEVDKLIHVFPEYR